MTQASRHPGQCVSAARKEVFFAVAAAALVVEVVSGGLQESSFPLLVQCRRPLSALLTFPTIFGLLSRFQSSSPPVANHRLWQATSLRF